MSLAASWFLLPHMLRKIHVRKLQNFCRQNRILVLTYDDGPCAEFTPKILDLLRKNDVKATFYVLGQKLENNVAISDRAHREGHEVASHSFSHLNAWSQFPWKVYRDIEHGLSVLDDLKIGSKLFRPPNGKMTVATMFQLLCLKRRVGWWTHDSTDTNPICTQPATIVGQLQTSCGGVVLMHDFARQKDCLRNEFVLDLTKQLIAMAKKEELKILTQRELLNLFGAR